MLRCTVERPNPRPFKSVYLQSLYYIYQRFCRIRFVYDVHNRILLSKGKPPQTLVHGDGGTWDNVHERGYPSYLSNSFPLLTPVRFPCIIMLTVQSRSFILTMKPSYSGLRLENRVMVNAIRSDTFIFLYVIRLRRITNSCRHRNQQCYTPSTPQ